MQNGRAVEVIKSRRSIRSYLDIQIPDSDLNSILEAGLYAPSGKNRQPWRFLIIKDKNKIRQISKFTAYSRFMHNAPVLVLVYLASSGDYSIEKDTAVFCKEIIFSKCISIQIIAFPAVTHIRHIINLFLSLSISWKKNKRGISSR